MSSSFYSLSPVKKICEASAVAHAHGKTVVLASGVFDLFHQEHENYLKKAKQVGDVLIVAVESNARTRELKGEGRPVHDEQKRLAHVRSVVGVDYAFILPENFNTKEAYMELLEHIRPDIYAASSHSGHLENKRALMEQHGGKLVIVHEHNPNISTTKALAGHMVQ
jgi:rfaE bifunctional protein nucleotidyltransferase chain/domain